jgi:ribonuclease HI
MFRQPRTRWLGIHPLPTRLDTTAYGGKVDTSLNEIELMAIDEALQLFRNREHVVIESDSKVCFDNMTDRGAKWEANNWNHGSPLEHAAAQAP